MNEKARSIFLCPDCGSPSTADGEGEAVCSDCQKQFAIPKEVTQKVEIRAAKTHTGAIQRNIVPRGKEPSLAFSSVENAPQPVTTGEFASSEDRPQEQSKRRRKIKKRSKKPARFYLGWVLLWLATVSIVLFVASRLQGQFGGTSRSALTIEESLVGEEKDFYRSEYPQIIRQFSSFIRSDSVTQRSDYVLPVKQVGRKMARHANENAFRKASDGLKPSPDFWNVAFQETPGFVEVVWDGESEGPFEAVFVKVGEKWLLDWEQFVRYNTQNWTLFRQQDSQEESGVFRVYVEKVAEGETSDFKAWTQVRLLPAYEDERRRRLEATELISLESGDPVADEISRLFLDKSGQSAGFSELWKRDQRNLKRAALRLEWTEDSVTGEDRIVIKEVLAQHWRSLELGEEGPPSKTLKKTATEDE